MSQCKVDMMKEGIDLIPRSCLRCGIGACSKGYTSAQHREAMNEWKRLGEQCSTNTKSIFTKAQLLELRGIIQDSIETKKILVPSSDFYSRGGDFEEENIRYIDAWKLEEALNRAIRDVN